MSRTPASGSSIESLAARRAQLKGALHVADREEPTLARSRRSEADMIDVVRKFEHTYASTARNESGSPHESDLAERAASAFSADGPSPQRDTLELDTELETPLAHRAGPVSIPPLESATDQFELPRIEPLPAVAESLPRHSPAQREIAAPRNRRKRSILVAATALALLIGVSLGYMLGPGRDSGAVRAKIDASEQGGTRLRMDYGLH